MINPLAAGTHRKRFTALLPALVEVILVLALAWITAGIIWRLLGHSFDTASLEVRPSPSLSITNRSTRPDLELLTRFDPFNRNVAMSGPASDLTQASAPETNLNLTLFGVRRNTTETRARAETGSAIIKLPSGDQRVFRVGDSILINVELAAIYTDHVRLRREGSEEALYLKGQAPGERERLIVRAVDADPRRTQSAVPSPTSTGVRRSLEAPNTLVSARQSAGTEGPFEVKLADLRRTFLSTRLIPKKDGTKVTGWALAPGAAASGLDAYGFEDGDTVRAINGQAFTKINQLEELSELVGAERLVTLSIDRGGLRQTIDFRLLR